MIAPVIAETQTTAAPSAALVILAFPIFFAALWVTVLKVISWLGGWSSWAEKFPAPKQPIGTRYSMRSLRMNFLGRYNNCITATLSRDGIHLVPFGPFRFAHPPLLIPWSCVAHVANQSFLVRWCVLSIRSDGKSMRIYLPATASDWISANLPPP